ncbi:type I glyceraldehyde-3-phosphate dehydrogenase [Thioclava sp.]|uniref:type I glyceraldehyde-3-phosphate dehydrogenase n=1 Tax=Thioclava sp. TaxID=1933450 RepID=UPI003AA7DC9C
MRVFINGFGRIGRSVLRAWAQNPDAWPGLDIVAINDIAAPDMLAYLLEYDSVFGPWRGTLAQEPGALVINDKRIALYRAGDVSTLDLNDIDLVMECTGRADTLAIAGQGLVGGASRVLISGPSKAAEITVVMGANDGDLNGQRIVSNASCTTNALAPLARLMDSAFGIVTGSMTTVHCYTASQPTVDQPRDAMERSRAASLSMVPTTTSAGRLMEQVLPDLSGRLIAQAVRVPTASVSAVDLAVIVKRPATVAQINATLTNAGGVIGTTDRPLVSTDLRARPESVVMALRETKITDHGLIRVFGWYDNEWGFSNRMLDMALRMA